MNIHFDNVNLHSRSGPNTFALRLYDELILQNHKVNLTANNVDVSLVFIEPSGRTLSKTVVQRLDGIWFKPENYYTHNIAIKHLYHNASGVIWQSEFDRLMTTRWWNTPNNGVVIHNGFTNNNYVQITHKFLNDIRSKYSQIFVCSSNWHPQKRLNSNIECFRHLKATQFPNSCLLILGTNISESALCINNDPSIIIFGDCDVQSCLQVYSLADWFIHLAWADHCPNVVVEALSTGLPVICSNTGGTKELVKDFGVVLNDATEYDFELIDYERPPMIDVTQLKKLPAVLDLGDHANINIKDVAKKYIETFELILSKR